MLRYKEAVTKRPTLTVKEATQTVRLNEAHILALNLRRIPLVLSLSAK